MNNMKKVILLGLLFGLGIMSPTFSQAFDVDTKVVALGLGLGSSIGPSGNASQFPGISLQYEQGMWDVGGPGVISLGGYVGYKGYSYKYSAMGIDTKSSWNYTIIGVRSAYHFTGLENDKLDLYAGLMLGYYFVNYKVSNNQGFSGGGGSYGNSFSMDIYAGARYYLNDKIGLFGELGYGVAFLNVGAVLKL